MTKIDMSAFEAETITKVKEAPPIKTKEQKLEEFRKANHLAYRRACSESQCTCTPTRAQMLLIDQYEGRHPIE
jgi:hypothetical protein